MVTVMRIKKMFKAMAFIVVLVVSFVVLAEDAAVNYSEEVRVLDRTPQERTAAFNKGLEQLLIKLTGNQDVTKMPKVQSQRGHAEVFVQSYTYVTHTDNGQEELFLQIKFDPQGMQQLLGQTATSRQSDILIWLAKRDGPQSAIITGDNAEFGAAFKTIGTDAHLNFVFPSMDLQDTNKITAQDLCAQNLELVKAASERYGNPTIVIGCVTKAADDKWSGQWLIQTKDNRSDWGLNGSASDIVADASKHIAQAFGMPITVPTKSIVLQVNGVNDLAQYADVVKYLRQLSPNSNFALISINANVMRLSVTGQQGQQELLVALSAQNKLVAEKENVAGVDLNYHWSATP